MHLAAGTLDRYVFILLRGRCEIRDGETAHDKIKMKIRTMEKIWEQFCVGGLKKHINENFFDLEKNFFDLIN